MREFGGFLPLETPGHGQAGPHPEALALATGRSCLSLALRGMHPQRVLLPYYICDSVVEAISNFGARIDYYPIDDQLLPARSLHPAPGTMLVLVDYFGIRSQATDAIAGEWGASCFLDRTQAFYAAPAREAWTGYSARKFFGVADGAYLYAPVDCSIEGLPESDPPQFHLIQRRLGNLETAFAAFQAYEAAIDCEPRRISQATRSLLATLDFAAQSAQRQSNARVLHRLLGDANTLSNPLPESAAPLCYPFLPGSRVDRRRLVEQRLFIPQFWREVVEKEGMAAPAWEGRLARDLLPLPVDQRYSESDMEELADRLRPLLA